MAKKKVHWCVVNWNRDATTAQGECLTCDWKGPTHEGTLPPGTGLRMTRIPTRKAQEDLTEHVRADSGL
jgi:hypothetical protein